ncbi:ABC transporter permease [Clostridium algidicarnis]|uniref:ABC transporter permease n=1 Tax=Clostridium algidicarnis TaxID=37659 RepID=UPI001C0ADC9B|nr:ABC transporter permease [Clostridium algidicarnis]MBU3207285.1 ABC transporter permease [Clostridium algidicarnis]
MKKYIYKRLTTTLIVLFGVSIVVFAMVHMQPGNPYIQMINPNIPAEQTEIMLKKLGFYDPLPIKYIKWVRRAVVGDFGYSIQFKEPVLSVINSRIWNTLLLSIVSSIISTAIAIPVGVISATKRNSTFDYLATIISFIGISIPSFFFGLLLIKMLSFDTTIFPISGMRTAGESYTGIKAFVDVAKHMVLPSLVLSFMNIAALMKYTRSSMIEVINKDYMRTAKAKGLKNRTVIWKHGFKNALITIITVLCMQIPYLFSGALLTETIFIWPGIGRLNYDAVLNRDYPLIMGILMIVAIIILLSNLVADVLYSIVDPRITYEE